MSEAPRDRLERALSPEVVAALGELVDERVAEALAAREHQEDGREWLTYAEAAEREGCSVDAMRMRVKRGRYGEPRPVGRRRYVSARSLES